jgi:acyl carrier protein
MDKHHPSSLLSFDEFRQIVADELHIDPEQVVREASFIEDLRADSIQLVSMMLSLEEKGINIPMEAAWDVETVGDAFRLYRSSFTGGA